MIRLPTTAEASAHLRHILARGSVNLGAASGVERLLLMLTRACQLRCGYCLVAKTEDGPDMPLGVARRAVDLLMRSPLPRLELQLFGGEPTARWGLCEEVFRYASDHPRRAGRSLRLLLTTNGLGLDAARVARLAALPATVLLSLDGDAATHQRYRPARPSGRRVDASAADDTTATAAARTWARIDRTVTLLNAHGVDWFANVVLPPAAATEVEARYAWARARHVPALQLSYAVGLGWSPEARRALLSGLAAVLLRDHHEPGGPRLFNWASDCEPVMLSDDLIVDVDGAVLHDGAIFLERRFPNLRGAYLRGHVDTLERFAGLRWPLATLFQRLVESCPPGSTLRRVALEDARLGAAVDLLIQRVARALGRPPSRGARP